MNMNKVNSRNICKSILKRCLGFPWGERQVRNTVSNSLILSCLAYGAGVVPKWLLQNPDHLMKLAVIPQKMETP